MQKQLHKYDNILNRNFTATKPNQKLVIDITYIHTNQGILYLSMIILSLHIKLVLNKQ